MDTKISFGMKMKSHSFLVRKGFEKVSKEIEIPLEKKIISTYSKIPDIDQVSNLNEWHFYDPAAKYLKGEKNAKILFQKHIKKSVKSFKKGKEKKAAKHLGRALHFLQDMFVPYHAQKLTNAQKVEQSANHLLFEKEIHLSKSRWIDKTKEITIDSKISFEEYVDTIIDKIAKQSKERLKLTEKEGLDNLLDNLTHTIQDAFDTTTEVLYRYAKKITT